MTTEKSTGLNLSSSTLERKNNTVPNNAHKKLLNSINRIFLNLKNITFNKRKIAFSKPQLFMY